MFKQKRFFYLTLQASLNKVCGVKQGSFNFFSTETFFLKEKNVQFIKIVYIFVTETPTKMAIEVH